MLTHRLLVSIPLIAVALLAFLTPGLPGAAAFFLLIAAALVLAVHEFFGVTGKLGYPGMPKWVMAVGLLQLGCIASGGLLLVGELESDLSPTEFLTIPLVTLNVFLILLLLGVFFLLCRGGASKQKAIDALVSLGGYLYICWPLSLAAGLFYAGGLHEMGPRLLTLFLLVGVRFGDTGGYVVGCSTAKLPGGNHKISPVLSPKKSWEGLFGSIAFSAIAAWLLVHFLGGKLSLGDVEVLALDGQAAVIFSIAFGVVCGLVGFLGDLAESALKRAAEVKDSGQIPGLGGALDLLDSVLVMAPICYLALVIYSEFFC